MLLLSLALLSAPLPADPTLARDMRSDGQGAWVEMSRDGTCTIDAVACAKRAFDLGDTAGSIKYLQAAARKGDTWAMRTIGLILMRGEGVAQDPETAVSWFYEAALRGDAQAMKLLGTSFREGLGVQRDPKLADFWTARANGR